MAVAVAAAAADAVVPSSARVSKSSRRSMTLHPTRQLTLCHPEMKADRFSFRKVVLESDRKRR